MYPEEGGWKPIYKDQWKPGADREKHVRELIENEFPDLKCALGYGAEKDERIPDDPEHKRGAPDQFWYYKGKLLFQVEVTGTDKVVEDYVWIRPDKLDHALTDRIKGIKTWFYVIYPNAEHVLDTELVEKFKDNLWATVPHGRVENYIHIPCDKTLSRNHLFTWIRDQQQAIVIHEQKIPECLPLWSILVETVHTLPMYPSHKAYVNERLLVKEISDAAGVEKEGSFYKDILSLSAKELSFRLGISLGEAMVILHEFGYKIPFLKNNGEK